MANRSGWKDSEKKAARLFPGGKRRTRVGGGSYATVADDVIWGPEHLLDRIPPRVVKLSFGHRDYPPVYVEVKKRTRVSEAVKMLRDAEKKYTVPLGGEVVLVQHIKGQKRQFVTVSDRFFAELIRSWCRERGLFLEELEKEESDGN